MSKQFKYSISCTHAIATIYEDDMIICKDILIEEKTLSIIIDKLNRLSEENEQLRKELDCIKKTNKSWGHNVECDYEWYEGIDKKGV